MAVLEKTRPKTKAEARAGALAAAKRTASLLGYALAAFFAAGVPLQGDVYPFGTAFLAGAPDRLTLPAVLGASLGAVVFSAPVTAVKNVGAALLLFVSREALWRIGAREKPAFWQPLLAFSAVLTASAAAGFFTPLSPTLLLTFFGEALLTAAMTAPLRRAGTALSGRKKAVLASGLDGVGLLLALGVELVFFSRVKLFGTDLAFLLAEVGLLPFAAVAGPTAAGAVGVTLGAVLGFRAGAGYLAFALPLSGFLVSAVAPYGKAPAAATYALTQLTFLFLKGEGVAAAAPAAVIMGVSVSFLFLPSKALRALERMLRPYTQKGERRSDVTRTRLRLKNAASAVRDVTAAMAKAAAAGEEASRPGNPGRRMTAAAFSRAGAVLEETALSLSESDEPEPYLASLIADALENCGVPCKACSAARVASGRLVAEALCPRLPDTLDPDAIVTAVRLKTGLDFSPPAVQSVKKDGALLLFCETGNLKIESARRVRQATGEGVCGDAVSRFYDGRGRWYCVLSDGMGTGKTAAADALLTAALTTRLIKGGLGPETALSCVNPALMLGSADETLATLDVLEVDLFTGEARLLKAGAAASVLRQGGKTRMVEKASLPLGILPDVSFEETPFLLSPGDTLVMTTDGADRLKPSRLRQILDETEGLPPDAVADAVTEAAVAASPIGRRDDVTVVAIRIGRESRNKRAEKRE
ncbi:MAG: SpoIIE family protein phosphatase [Clostridia bacterium]|nr:SpoIIE family protein phosphatase [Clostridia bacterium]